MLALVVAMVAILLLSIAVVTYVAYPHRGREVPQVPWLSDAMRKGVAKLPTLDEDEQAALRRAEASFLGKH